MKKRWILIPLTAGLLALMVAGGAILAQSNGHSPSVGYPNDLASRVAEILNLDEATVQSAFSQAQRERQNERLQALLERMVAADLLTQEEADEMMNWFVMRPDAAVRLSGAVFFGGESMQRRLEHLLRAGALTEAEAEEVQSWREQRPDVPPTIGHGHRDKRSGFHRGPCAGVKKAGTAALSVAPCAGARKTRMPDLSSRAGCTETRMATEPGPYSAGPSSAGMMAAMPVLTAGRPRALLLPLPTPESFTESCSENSQETPSPPAPLPQGEV